MIDDHNDNNKYYVVMNNADQELGDGYLSIGYQICEGTLQKVQVTHWKSCYYLTVNKQRT